MNNWFHFTNKTILQLKCVLNSGFLCDDDVPAVRVYVSVYTCIYVFFHLCGADREWVSAYVYHSHKNTRTHVFSITTFHRWLSPWFGTLMALNTFNTCSAYFTQQWNKIERKIWGNRLFDRENGWEEVRERQNRRR